jgi:ribosome assembly protein YihI (activator of Der GTPase)
VRRILGLRNQRQELLDEAARIGQAAEKAGRTISGEEDATVLALMARVRTLEEQLGHLRRHHHEDDRTRNRSENK